MLGGEKCVCFVSSEPSCAICSKLLRSSRITCDVRDEIENLSFRRALCNWLNLHLYMFTHALFGFWMLKVESVESSIMEMMTTATADYEEEMKSFLLFQQHKLCAIILNSSRLNISLMRLIINDFCTWSTKARALSINNLLVFFSQPSSTCSCLN